MPIETDDDRAVFVEPDDGHGVIAEWSPPGGWNPQTVNGIFRNEFLEQLVDDPEAGIGTSQPLFTFRTIDVPDVTEGYTFVIDGITYLVTGPAQPDGTGMTTVRLYES